MAAGNFRHELMAIPEDSTAEFEISKDKFKTAVYSVSPRMAPVPKLPPIGGNACPMNGSVILSPVREDELASARNVQTEPV